MEVEKEIYRIKMAILVLADYLEIENHTSFEIVAGIQEILNKELTDRKESLWIKLWTHLKTVGSAGKLF